MNHLKPALKAVGSFIAHQWLKLIALLLIIVVVGMVALFLENKNQLAQQEFKQQLLDKKKQYIADQRDSCLAIYKEETAKFSGVSGWRYDSAADKCYVQYKQVNPLTYDECRAAYQSSSVDAVNIINRDAFNACINGLFEKAF